MINYISKDIEIEFGESPFEISSMHILPNSTKVCSESTQGFLIRTLDELFDPVLLTKTHQFEDSNNSIKFLISDELDKYFLKCTISKYADGIKFHVKLDSSNPVWMLEWKLSGLELNRITVPALGGQCLNNTMPNKSSVSYKYPFWWNAQFVIGEMMNGCIKLDGRDSRPDLKMLRVSKEDGKFDLTYGIEANAPIKDNTLEGEWYLEYFSGGWKQATEDHQKWMEKAFSLSPRKLSKESPQWIENINFILEIWGAQKGKNSLNTFQQMRNSIKLFSTLHPAENTLLYLPGFAENGIDSHAPEYNPSKECGGEEDFRLLVEYAHELGYKVMIHTNVLALTYSHRIFKEFEKYQVIDVFNRPQGWAMDMDGDWLTEPYFAYMIPGFTEWGDYMTNVIGELIFKFNIDGVFLDQTLLAFNVSKGPNFLEGMRNHIKRLKRDHPNTLFAGEGLHEQNVEALQFAQIHGIDSIAGVHAMDEQVPWREVHPVSTTLFKPYSRFAAHLLTKHPSHPLFKYQEESYSALNVIPALCLYDNKQEILSPELEKMIVRAKKIGLETNEEN